MRLTDRVRDQDAEIEELRRRVQVCLRTTPAAVAVSRAQSKHATARNRWRRLRRLAHGASFLLDAGHDVTVVDNLVYGHAEAVRCPLVRAEISERETLDRVFAAAASTRYCTSPPTRTWANRSRSPPSIFRTTSARALALLDVMLAHGVTRLVFSSTCATYGEPNGRPLTEDEATPHEPVRRDQAQLRAGALLVRQRLRVALG